MPAVAEMLKASEAAVVSRVSLRDVNRVINEHILPDAFVSLDNGRHVLAGACSLIAFYFESARRLTSEERLFAIRTAEVRLAKARTLPWAALLREDWTVQHEFLTIDLMPFMRRANGWTTLPQREKSSQPHPTSLAARLSSAPPAFRSMMLPHP